MTVVGAKELVIVGAGAGQCAKLAHGVQGGAYEAVQHPGE
ncbi:hypothetical protein Nocox_17705 [Nonomuraea coxensis DSM 45129]|uniref:Uncharacterized protein n=1 Tax=Nonomuraea coxensis DSM 45129 TaxID=1122611 RepID=A0ABX8U0I7_9ACTN|nr:hypothetical protein Nocox_17705 [Nonomuraea coxensis DSM 45129]